MILTLKHSDLEEAIRDYLIKNGIDKEVDDMNFTVSRSGGSTVTTELTLATEKVKQAQAVLKPVPKAPVEEAVEAPEGALEKSTEPAEVIEEVEEEPNSDDSGKSLFG